ncbi:MAG TPA: hypothetical protein VKH19_13820 [Gemmatimonadaceae bacterium]|nr:hypothetical protein [Gemmatimonadaceae bacterium]
MKNYFPKNTVQWHFEEPTALRRFSLSLWEMALLTGVSVRLYRALVITHSSTSWLWTGGTIAFGLLLLCAMTTVHLANFPLKRWVWRAPLFAALESAAEALTSVFLIAIGREPIGSARAEWSEWPTMAWDTLWTRELVVCGWALLLAGVVTVVRRTIMRPEQVEEEPEPTEDTAQA